MLMLYLREIWHFKLKRLLHQGIVNGSIANFFTILLQYNSKHRIVLFTVLQKKNLYFTPPISLEISLSSLSFFLFSSLSSFFVLHLLSPLWSLSSKFLTHLRNFSPISHGLSLISHRTASLSVHRCWVLDFWGWRLD